MNPLQAIITGLILLFVLVIVDVLFCGCVVTDQSMADILSNTIVASPVG